jgi:cell fate regulator YaaT (PSP1 superfamily)
MSETPQVGGAPESSAPSDPPAPVEPEAAASAPPPAENDQPAPTEPETVEPAPAESESESAKPAPAKSEKKSQPTVIVRYGMMGNVGQFRHNLKAVPRPGTQVVARTERGVELGEVIASVSDKTCAGCVSTDRLGEFLRSNGSDYPFRRGGKVLRIANHQDVIDQRHLSGSAKEEAQFCREQVKELKLKMKLVAVDHLLGGERIVFYFSAETRVDFRDLVRRLAGQYRTRIEMRQVGARDEARLVGDFERCGRQCCCQVFIKDLKPVSMRMAKMQKATLDPSKISGRCGRLMCCLRFEDVGYEDLRARLPRKNTWVRTETVTGRVVDTQILTQLVRLEKTDRTQEVVTTDDIVERDLKPPPPPEKPAASSDRTRGRRPERGRDAKDARPRRERAARPASAAAPEAPAAAAETPTKDGEGAPAKKKRRRGRRKRRGGGEQAPGTSGQAPPQQGQAPQAAPQQGQASQAPAQQGEASESAEGVRKKDGSPPKRRRRRRKKK